MSWINDDKAAAENFAGIVTTAPESIFKLTITEDGGQFRVFGKARIGSSKVPVKQVLLKMPEYLKDKIGQASMGHEQTVCLGLIEFALLQLEKEGKTLVVENKAD